MQFKFEPTQVGNYSGTYTITLSDQSNGNIIPLYANGAATNGVLLTGTSIAGGLALDNSANIFGVYTPGQTSATVETELRNTSADTLNISLAEDGSSQDANFNVVTGTCGATLAPGAFCDVKVKYVPTETGTQVLTEFISASDAVTSQTVGVYDSTESTIVTGITETGYSIASATFEASATSHAFGEVGVNGTSSGFATTLYNSTASNLALSTGWSNTAESSDFTLYSSSCGATLPANSVCVLKFEFTPQSAAMFDNTYQIQATSSGYNGTVSVELTGTGIN